MNIKMILKSSLIVTLALTFLIGCGTKWDDDEAASSITSAVSGGAAPVATTPTVSPATVDSFGLLEVTETSYSYNLHREGVGNVSAECKIDSADLSTTRDPDADGDGISVNDVTCYMDAEELDLYINGAKFQLTLPEDSCEYVRYRPYWFWQYQAGTSDQTYNTYTVWDSECQDAFDNTGTTDEVPPSTWAYDYSTNVEPGPNCDDGTVTEIINYYGASAASQPEVSTISCIAVAAAGLDTLYIALPGSDNYLWFSGGGADPTPLGRSSGIEIPFLVGTTAAELCLLVANAIETNFSDDYFISDFTPSGTDVAMTVTATAPADLQDIGGDAAAYFTTDVAVANQGLLVCSAIATPTGQPAENVTEHGGNWNDCIAGPGKDHAVNADGYPLSTVYNTNDGEQKTWEYEAPITKLRWSNIYLANYTKKSACHDSSYDFEDATFKTYSIQEGAGTEVIGPRRNFAQPYYEWSCLDKAYEVKGRLRIMIREWDTDFELATAIDQTEVADINFMDVAGVDGFGGNNNDIWDWDDWELLPVDYSAVDCNNAAAQGFNFPEDWL